MPTICLFFAEHFLCPIKPYLENQSENCGFQFQASNSSLKENIGSYIWSKLTIFDESMKYSHLAFSKLGKLGTLGYLTGAQTFKPGQFYNIVSIIIHYI